MFLTNVANPDDHKKISVSEWQSYMFCPQQHEYGYKQGLGGLDTPGYLSKGKYLHKLMELGLKYPTLPLNVLSNESLLELKKEEAEPVSETDRRDINELFSIFIKEVLQAGGYTVVGTEIEFKVDVGFRLSEDSNHLGGGLRQRLLSESEPVLLHGFIDAVIRDDNGHLWIVEHKTAAKSWSEIQYSMDIQAPVYSYAWYAVMGELPIGIIYNFFYPKRAEQRTRFVLPEHMDSIMGEGQRIVESIYSDRTYRSMNWTCNMCRFKTLCYTELIGEDSSLLRETHFKVDEEKVSRYARESREN